MKNKNDLVEETRRELNAQLADCTPLNKVLDLFSREEVQHLVFLRWLHATGRLNERTEGERREALPT